MKKYIFILLLLTACLPVRVTPSPTVSPSLMKLGIPYQTLRGIEGEVGR